MRIFCSIILACSFSSLSYADIENNGACPDDTSLTTACVQIENRSEGKTNIQVTITQPHINIIATPGNYAHYQFDLSSGSWSFLLSNNFDSIGVDGTCQQHEWAVNIAEGKTFLVENLIKATYKYAYGLEMDGNSGGYRMVNCDSNITS